jgi:hypothetical protein
MPDGLDDLLGDNSNGSGDGQGGKGLRAQLEAALQREKALNERFEKLAQTERTRSLDALFSKHSIPELAKDLFPPDTEPTDEAATALVEKYGSLWGASAQVATTPPDQQAATTAMQQFASQANPAPVAPLSEEAYRAKLAEATTQTELLQLIAELESTAVTGMGD